MSTDDAVLPDPSDAGFYARYVDLCHRLGVEPSPPQRFRDLVSKRNAMLSGEQSDAHRRGA